MKDLDKDDFGRLGLFGAGAVGSLRLLRLALAFALLVLCLRRREFGRLQGQVLQGRALRGRRGLLRRLRCLFGRGSHGDLLALLLGPFDGLRRRLLLLVTLGTLLHRLALSALRSLLSLQDSLLL